MIIHDVEQGTEAWHKLRLGKPTASRFGDIVTPLGKLSTKSEGYLDELLLERFFGCNPDGAVKTQWMQRGNDLEQEAADKYEAIFSCTTEKVGFITDDNNRYGCSPDRFIHGIKLLEIKCPKAINHINLMRGDDIDNKYIPQIQGQLMITDFCEASFMSYHPFLPPVIMTVNSNKKYTTELKSALEEFCDKLDEETDRLAKSGEIYELAQRYAATKPETTIEETDYPI